MDSQLDDYNRLRFYQLLEEYTKLQIDSPLDARKTVDFSGTLNTLPAYLEENIRRGKH